MSTPHVSELPPGSDISPVNPFNIHDFFDWPGIVDQHGESWYPYGFHPSNEDPRIANFAAANSQNQPHNVPLTIVPNLSAYIAQEAVDPRLESSYLAELMYRPSASELHVSLLELARGGYMAEIYYNKNSISPESSGFYVFARHLGERVVGGKFKLFTPNLISKKLFRLQSQT
jgi:hypothetical protein